MKVRAPGRAARRATRALSRGALAAALLTGAVAGVGAVTPAAAVAQSAADHVALGDKVRYTNPTEALGHYEAAVQADPRDYLALTRAAVVAVDVGEAAQGAQQSELYRKGEDYAKRAIAVKATDGEGHFALARALGRRAQAMGSRDRVKFAAEVRGHAMEALKYAPQHAGALHIMGMWNAEVMRLSGVSRFMAKNFLGGKVFDSANWDDAQRYLEQAVAAEPNRLIHRIDLAEVLLDRGDKTRARQQIDAIRRAPAAEANDTRYKRHAEELARRL
jgi:tetratricopeptide (TPR) repeat protein